MFSFEPFFLIITYYLAPCYRTHENSQWKGEAQTSPVDKKKSYHVNHVLVKSTV